jgi:MFS family permease
MNDKSCRQDLNVSRSKNNNKIGALMSAPTTEPAATGTQETLQLLLISTAHFISHVHLMVLPALVPLLPQHFNVSFLDVGFAITVFNLVSLFLQTPMGFITDRLGAWRMLVCALVLGGASFGLLAVTANYQWLLVAMAAAGIANTVYHPADYAILSSSIREARLGRAFSVHTFAGFFGTAITPSLLLGTANRAGVGYAFAMAGVISLAVAAILLAARPLWSDSRKHHVTPSLPAEAPKRLMSLAVLLLTMLFAFLSLNTSGLQAFSVTSMVNGYGMDLGFANAILTSFLFASAFGILAGGLLAERTQRHGLFAASALLIAAGLAAVIALTAPGGVALITMMTAIGFLAGVITPSRDIIVRAAAPRGAEGRVFGIVSTGFNIGGAVGPLLFAWLVDRGQYQNVFAVTALFMVTTAVLTMLPVLNRK